MPAPFTSMQDTFTRRTFLRWSLAAAATTVGHSAHAASLQAPPASLPWFGAMRSLPLGAVLPDGWLKGWLQKQSEGLGTHLPEVSWPFTQDYWGEEHQGAYFTPEQEYEVWWPWEQKGYWIDGTTRLAVLLQQKDLLAKATRPISYTLSHPDLEGYLGPEVFQDPLADYHRWPHAVFFRSVAAAYDSNAPLGNLTHADVTAAMQHHYRSDQASYGKPKRNVNNIEAMLWLYGQTGDKHLLEFAESTWLEYQKYADDPENADLGRMRVEGDTPINAHGETYAETSKQPAILYLYTGKAEYLRFAEADQRRMFDHHMLIDGVPSTSEWFGTRTALDSHETCDIADHTWSWGYMLQATGNAIWGDRIERACFNAGMGAIKKDWRALQYLSCPNQVLATLTSDHNWPKFKEHGGSMMAFQPNPGLRTACCGGNVHRIFPNYVSRMWMTTQDEGLAAVLYGPSTVRAEVGNRSTTVEITQETNYPFEEQIRFRIASAEPATFPLSLRIPAWCATPQLTINGQNIPIDRDAKGFAVIARTFHNGDQILLTLPMQVEISHWPQSGIGIERGPLVYSLAIEPHWTSKIVPRYSTADFPSWEATPTTPWNFGLALDPAQLQTEIAVKTAPATSAALQDPWSHPTIQLTVRAKRITDWVMQTDPADATLQFTPPLPELSESKISDRVEQLILVPYGSTHLRLTIFPNLNSRDAQA